MVLYIGKELRFFGVEWGDERFVSVEDVLCGSEGVLCILLVLKGESES